MASRSRRKAASIGAGGDVPPDTRPLGSLFYADPSTCVFAQHIHTFDPVPHSSPPVTEHRDMFSSESGAINTTDRRMLRMHDPLWAKRHPEG